MSGPGFASETVETTSRAETEALGARLATRLEPGDVVLLSGELGTGKTTLVRGACRELGVEGPVTSPTFTVGQTYAGRVGISHLDLHRIGGLEPEEPGLLDDYLAPERIAFVEWPGDGAGAELRDGVRVAARITLEHAGADRRRIAIEPA